MPHPGPATRSRLLIVALAAAAAVAVASAQERPQRRISLRALVGTITFGTDGRTVTAWDTAGFSVWNLETGRNAAREPVFGKPCGRKAVLPRSDDGTTIGVHCQGRLFLFDTETGRSLGEWPLRDKQSAVAFTASPDGASVASVLAGATSTVEVSGRSGAPTVLRAQQEVEQLSFTKDGRRLATGSVAGVEIWDLPEGRLLHTFAGGPAHAFAPDGTSIAIVRGRGVVLADVSSGQETRTLDGSANQVRFGPDGRTVAGWTNQQAIVWDAATGAQRYSVKADQLVTAALAPDGSRLATISLELRGNSTASILSVWELPR